MQQSSEKTFSQQIITIAVIVANLLAEFLYGQLDPRVRVAGGK